MYRLTKFSICLLATLIFGPNHTIKAQEALYVNTTLRVFENLPLYVGGDLNLDNNSDLHAQPGANLLIKGDVTNSASAGLTLEANSTKYAQLQFEGSYSGSGTVEHQMYFAGGWHMVGASMNATTAGYFGNVGSNAVGGTINTQNLFFWDGSQYVNVANNSASITPGVGYFGYVGDYGFHDDGDNTNNTGAGTYSFTGSPNSSIALGNLFNSTAATNITIQNGQANQGWNLVANPFTCTIDFDLLGRTGLDNSFYIYDPNKTGGAGYESMSAAGIGETTIAPKQSFWVRANGSGLPSLGTLSMKNHCNLAGSPKFFKQTKNFDRLVLRTHPLGSDSIEDYTVVSFVEHTSKSFDSKWDAYKLLNSGDIPNIYSDERDALSINAIDFGPNYPEADSIAISYRAAHHGQAYEISFDKSFMIYSYAVFLEDKKLASFTDLNKEPYQFLYDSTHISRFVLHFSSQSVGLAELLQRNQASLEMWYHQGKIHFIANYKGRTELSLMDLSGRILWHSPVSFDKNKITRIQMNHSIPEGIYLLHSQEKSTSYRQTVLIKL